MKYVESILKYMYYPLSVILDTLCIYFKKVCPITHKACAINEN